MAFYPTTKITSIEYVTPDPKPTPEPTYPTTPAPKAPYMSSPPNTRYFFVPPPYVSTQYVKYQDVNNDKNLQEKETEYFLNKTIDWITFDSKFKSSKKYLSKLKGQDGYYIMYKILKLFVRKGDTNWYDLKVQKSLVKDFIRHKLK